MSPALDLLFVYGTLHPHRAPAEIAGVVSQFVFFGSGTVRGQLHQLPHYPALRLDPQGEPVPGLIFVVPPEAWPALDAYEGYTPYAPEAMLFRRQRTQVSLENAVGTAHQQCWIYTYARGIPA